MFFLAMELGIAIDMSIEIALKNSLQLPDRLHVLVRDDWQLLEVLGEIVGDPEGASIDALSIPLLIGVGELLLVVVLFETPHDHPIVFILGQNLAPELNIVGLVFIRDLFQSPLDLVVVTLPEPHPSPFQHSTHLHPVLNLSTQILLLFSL